MCCDQMACGSCGGPVGESRCPTCRATRAQLHSGGGQLPVQLVVALALLAALLLVALQRVTA